MINLRSVRESCAPLALAVGLFGLTGCGLGVGDHLFYRVTLAATSRDAGCYNNNTIPDDVRDDTTNLADGTTFIIFIAGDEQTELDTGTFVVQGAATDLGYTFSGNVKDVDYPNGETRTTLTKITIAMTIDGSTMKGTNTTVITRTCTGANCPGGYDRVCTEKTAFKGVEMDDDAAQVLVNNTPAP